MSDEESEQGDEPDPNWMENDAYATSDDELTKSASTRWEWLGTLVAGTTVGTFLLLIVANALGILMLSALAAPWSWLLAGAVASAYAYSLGKDFYKWRQEVKDG